MYKDLAFRECQVRERMTGTGGERNSSSFGEAASQTARRREVWVGEKRIRAVFAKTNQVQKATTKCSVLNASLYVVRHVPIWPYQCHMQKSEKNHLKECKESAGGARSHFI